jgi:tRNA(fMet)-specific endonuclease VapC
MPFLLDTNACVEYLRGRSALLVQRIAARSVTELRLCSVVKAELYFGAYRSAQAQSNLAKVNAFVQQFLSLPFDDAAADAYGRIRADLTAKGTPIGSNDYLIAAIAVAHGVTLVSHNVRDFSRVAGLTVEDWEVP